MENKVRIIGGDWRGRKILVPSIIVRPTPNRVKETLFNWLENIVNISGCDVLDLFSGSGSLGFEALSRGFKSATMIENNKHIYNNLLLSRKILQANNIDIILDDACKFTQKKYKSFSIIFVDPPFNKDLVKPVVFNLLKNKFTNDDSILYVESEYKISEQMFNNKLNLLKQKKTSQLYYSLMSINSNVKN